MPKYYMPFHQVLAVGNRLTEKQRWRAYMKGKWFPLIQEFVRPLLLVFAIESSL